MVMKSNVGMSSQDSGETHAASSDIEAGTQSNLCVDSIRKKLSQRPNLSLLWPTSCIYRVPLRIRQVMEDAYTPETVLIGPYHRVVRQVMEDACTPETALIGPYQRVAQKEKVTADLIKAMENHKLAYVQAVVDRTKETTSLDDYVNTLINLEAKARQCYSESLNDLSSEKFVEMMLIDGLFIIELFRKYEESGKDESEEDSSDPIFNSVMGASVMRDMVMLENQIPMLVLQKLFDLSMGRNPASPTLIEMALSYFDSLLPDAISNKYPGDKNNTGAHNHLVDLLSYTICSSLPTASDESTGSDTELAYLPRVTDLQLSGVKFKMGSTSGSLMDIKFDKGKGVFEIPPTCIHDLTDSFFRNLIAYEQCRLFQGTFYITSYAMLMFNLIKSADDVAILRECGIITNQLGDDNKVSSLFINLQTGSSILKFSYYQLCKDVNDYYKKPYHKWKAGFKRNYCNSPWSIVSVVVAPILFFVTVWATVFTTLPVFQVSG